MLWNIEIPKTVLKKHINDISVYTQIVYRYTIIYEVKTVHSHNFF